MSASRAMRKPPPKFGNARQTRLKPPPAAAPDIDVEFERARAEQAREARAKARASRAGPKVEPDTAWRNPAGDAEASAAEAKAKANSPSAKAELKAKAALNNKALAYRAQAYGTKAAKGAGAIGLATEGYNAIRNMNAPGATVLDQVGQGAESMGRVATSALAAKAGGSAGMMFGGPWGGAAGAVLGGIAGYAAPEAARSAYNYFNEDTPIDLPSETLQAKRAAAEAELAPEVAPEVAPEAVPAVDPNTVNFGNNSISSPDISGIQRIRDGLQERGGLPAANTRPMGNPYAQSRSLPQPPQLRYASSDAGRSRAKAQYKRDMQSYQMQLGQERANADRASREQIAMGGYGTQLQVQRSKAESDELSRQSETAIAQADRQLSESRYLNETLANQFKEPNDRREFTMLANQVIGKGGSLAKLIQTGDASALMNAYTTAIQDEEFRINAWPRFGKRRTEWLSERMEKIWEKDHPNSGKKAG